MYVGTRSRYCDAPNRFVVLFLVRIGHAATEVGVIALLEVIYAHAVDLPDVIIAAPCLGGTIPIYKPHSAPSRSAAKSSTGRKGEMPGLSGRT